MSSPAQPAASRTLTIDQLFVEACVALQKGDGLLSRRLFRLVLVHYPHHAGALHNLGVIAAFTGAPDEAERHKRRARDAQPDVLDSSEPFGPERMAVQPVTPLRPLEEWNTHHRQSFIWFEHAQKFLQVNRIDGVYAEFGCHEVNTFRFALNSLGLHGRPNRISHFYAFDSFEGMPEPVGIDRQKIWRRGMNHTPLEVFLGICRRDLYRITAIKGFFQDSLPKVVWNPEHTIALAYIDVDYYSSTREVLDFIKGKLRHGSLIAFDDWNCYYADSQRGQRRACAEFEKEIAGTARLEPFLPISFGGMSFVYQELDKLGREVL